jgi:hypothetical protein
LTNANAQNTANYTAASRNVSVNKKLYDTEKMKAVVAETENPQPKYFIVLVIRWKLMVIHNDVLSIDIVCEDFWTSSMTLYL